MQNCFNFFDSDDLKLPKSWVGHSGDFIDYIKEVFNSYQKRFDKFLKDITDNWNISDEIDPIEKGYKKKFQKNILERIKERRNVANELIKGIIQSLEVYFNGRMSNSYEIFKSLLNKGYLKDLITENVNKDDPYSPFSDLYRLRESNEDLSGSPLNLFHVPYDRREHIPTQRYSIPGFPCLYLGGSLKLCWEECNKPSKILWAAKYEPACNTFRLLNLGYTPEVWKMFLSDIHNVYISKYKDLFVAHAVCWPLIAACSIKRRNHDSKFAPEYVIPQMLLQWVMEYQDEHGRIDGIRYFSTRVPLDSNNIKPSVNYVFPAVKTDNDKNYSRTLAEKFMITMPMKVAKQGDSYAFADAESELKYEKFKSLKEIICDDVHKKSLENKNFKMLSHQIRKLERRVCKLKRKSSK